MKGKTAVLKVKIAPDGLIISIGSCEGIVDLFGGCRGYEQDWYSA